MESVATKGDLAEVVAAFKSDIAALRSEIVSRLDALEAKVSGLETVIREQIERILEAIAHQHSASI